MNHEDYLSCAAYENREAHPSESNFVAFFEDNRYFFALVDADGGVLLKSEGYPQVSARENGIQSVIKNRVNSDFYTVKQENDTYYLSLRAANYREIARSCDCNSEAEALALLPFLTGEKVRSKKSDRNTDEYLACSAYSEQGVADSDGIVRFKHTDGMHYFAWVDYKGEILMRSESYPTTGARDNGAASVVKNRDNEARYSITEDNGETFVALKAGNHQEIARSCPFADATAAAALLPSNRKAAEAARLAAAAADTEGERLEDDYMVCSAYENRPDAGIDGYANMAKFTADNAKHYFVWYADNGDVLMRSEGYPTTGARDNGMASVAKNRDIHARYATEEVRGLHYVILKAGNHQEIARSCPYKSLAALYAAFPDLNPDKGSSIAAAALVAPAAASLIDMPEAEAEKPQFSASVEEIIAQAVDVEDDYLVCKAYVGHTESPRKGFYTFKNEKTGKYYFAVIDSDGDVSLRSEGHLTAAERDADLEDVAQNLMIKERYEIKNVGLTHHFVVLRNAEGKEIARSCAYGTLAALYADAPFLNPDRSKVAAAAIGAAAIAPEIPAPVVEVAAPIQAPEVVAPPPPVYQAPEVVAAPAQVKGGLPWWLWPLLGLAILALLWMLLGKGCNMPSVKEVTAPPAIKAEGAAATSTATAPTTAPAPAAAATPDCQLNWIFFDFDKADVRADAKAELTELATMLKNNSEYTAVLEAYTDAKGSAEYNQALSARRASNAKKVLESLGIAANRVKTSQNGKTNPYAQNTNDDAGRKYNRRVEIYVKDKTGKDICKSIPPATDLKVR